MTLYNKSMALNTTKLKAENITGSAECVRKFSMRAWSPMRCMRSPVILVSKKPIGKRMSFAKKSLTMETLIRVPMNNKIRLCRNCTTIWLKNSINWASKTR